MIWLLPTMSADPDATDPATIAWVKYCNAKITEFTTPNSSTGAIVGSVILRNCMTGPAPSSCAASYRSLGTSRIAARMMIMISPEPHSVSSVSAGFDRAGSLNHSGPSTPNQPSTVFTGPVPGLNTKTNVSVAATGGTSDGR